MRVCLQEREVRDADQAGTNPAAVGRPAVLRRKQHCIAMPVPQDSPLKMAEEMLFLSPASGRDILSPSCPLPESRSGSFSWKQ